MLTFFCSPQWWWWGGPVADYRWNFIGGIMLLGSTLITGGLQDRRFLGSSISRRFLALALLTALNATFVHFLIAPNTLISSTNYSIVVKTMVLFGLMIACIRSYSDLQIVMIAILLGAFYIGYEVTINERGHVHHNRLEGIGVANASTANDLACLMVCIVPLIVPVFLFGSRWQKVLAMVTGPFILNVLLLCNSRGAFLSLAIVGAIFAIASPKRIRPLILKVGLLGLIAGWLLLGDPKIIERFATTFVSAEERDASASGRMDFWKAGLMMIADYPLGAGGDGFRKVYGAEYIGRVTGEFNARSVHEGYINEACEWGLQGLLLRLMILGGGIALAFKTSRLAIAHQSQELSVVCIAVIASLSGLLVTSLFGNFLDDEWALWLVAIAIGCHRLVRELTEEDELEIIEY